MFSKYAVLLNVTLKIHIYTFFFTKDNCFTDLQAKKFDIKIKILGKILCSTFFSTLCSTLCFNFVFDFRFRPTRPYISTLRSTIGASFALWIFMCKRHFICTYSRTPYKPEFRFWRPC